MTTDREPSATAASPPAEPDLPGPIGVITPDELTRWGHEAATPTILDVRSRREYRRGHLPGAVHLPFFAVGRHRDRLPTDPTTPLVVYCGHGPRAWWAARALRRLGFLRISLLRGHFTAWKRRGGRLTTESSAPSGVPDRSREPGASHPDPRS